MKYALITGGANGMGRATAIKLAQNGYHVFSCDIQKNKDEIENITQLIVDVTKTESINKAFDYVKKITDKLDAVIHFCWNYYDELFNRNI